MLSSSFLLPLVLLELRLLLQLRHHYNVRLFSQVVYKFHAMLV